MLTWQVCSFLALCPLLVSYNCCTYEYNKTILVEVRRDFSDSLQSFWSLWRRTALWRWVDARTTTITTTCTSPNCGRLWEALWAGGIRQVGPSQNLVGYYMNTSRYLMSIFKYFSKANIMIQGYQARLNWGPLSVGNNFDRSCRSWSSYRSQRENLFPPRASYRSGIYVSKKT